MPSKDVGEASIDITGDATNFRNVLRATKTLAESMGAGIAGSFAKVLRRENEAVVNGFKGIRDGLQSMVRIFTVLGPVATSALSGIAGGAVALASSLYQTVMAGFSLVGVLGAMVVGVATTVVAFQGMGDALKGNEDALNSLAPSARNVVNELTALKDAGTELRQTVQQAFFKGLADDVKILGETYLPILRDEMTKMAGAINGTVTEIAQWAATDKVVSDFGVAMQGNTSIVEKLGVSAKPILQGMLDLYIALTPSAERLADSIGGIAEKFAAWAAAGRESGSIAEFMDKAQDSAGLLLGMLKNLALVLHDVFTASQGAGDGLIQSMSEGLATFREWTSSIEGQASIAQWASDGADMLRNIADVAGALAPIFQELAKPEIFNALLSIISSMGDTLSTIMPYVSPIIAGFAQLLSTLAPILGPLLAIAAAAQSLIFVGTIIRNIVMAFSFLKNIITAVRIVWMALSIAFAASPIGLIITLIAALVAGLVWFFTQTETGKAIWENVWGAIKDAVAAVSEWFTGTFLPAITGVWDAITGGVSTVWEAIVSAFEAVRSFLGGIVDWVVEWGGRLLEFLTWPYRMAWQVLVTVLTAIWSFIQTIFGAVAGFVSSVWSGITNAVSTAVAVVRAVVSAGFQLVRTVITTVLNAVRSVVTTVWNGIRNAIQTALNAIRSVVTNVFNFVRGYITRAVNTWRSVITSAWNAIRNAVSTAVNAVRSVISNVLSGITGFIRGVWNTVTGVFRNAWNSIRTAVSNGINTVMGLIRGLPGRITGAIGNLGSLLYNAGKNVIQGLINGINNMIGRVRDAASSVASAIRNFFPFSPAKEGPLKKNPPEKAGENIGKAIAKGLYKSKDAVKKAAKQIASQLDVAKEKLEEMKKEAKDFSASIRESFAATGSALTIGQGQEEVTFESLIAGMRDAKKEADSFNAVMAKLGDLGLNKAQLEELYGKGPEALGIAQAIADGGKAGVAEINALQSGIAKAANSTASNAYNDLFATGIQAGEGLVKGLEKQIPKIVKAAKKFGKEVVKAVKQILDIKSPSKVFEEIGTQIPAGTARGIDSGAAGAVKAARDMLNPSALGASTAGGGGAGTYYEVSVHIDVDTMRQMTDVADFLEMLDRQRVNARRTQRSGRVATI